jgi:PAS domain S-box-containing protein
MNEKLKEKIEELEGKHRLVADNLLDAIWVIDIETLKYDFITPSIEKLSGYTADEFKNFALKDRLTAESFRKVETILAKEVPKFEQGVKAIRTVEVELFHKSGHTFWAEIRAKFIKESGQPLKIIGVTREITKRKKVEQQQNELIRKLGAALAEKDRLLKEIKVLRGLLPICSGCKRIRDEENRWWPLDAYVKSRTDAEITHTICPDCTEVLYDDL